MSIPTGTKMNTDMDMSMSMSIVMNMVMFTVTLISIHMRRIRNTLMTRKQGTVTRTGTWQILKRLSVPAPSLPQLTNCQ